MFDAGAIEAHMTLERSQFQRDLAQMLAEYKAMKAELEKGVDVPIRLDPRGRQLIGPTVPFTQRARTATEGGLIGTDPILLKKLEQEAATPGGIGIIGIGNDSSLARLLRIALQKAAEGTGPGLLGGGASGTDTQKIIQKVVGGEPNAPGPAIQDVIQKVVGGTPGGDILHPDIVPIKYIADASGLTSLLRQLTALHGGSITENIDINGLAQAQGKMAALGVTAAALDTALRNDSAAAAELAYWVAKDQGAANMMNEAFNASAMDTAFLRAQMQDLTLGLKKQNDAAAASALPLSTLAFGWGKAGGNVQLFGGILRGLGIPAIFASVGAVHLLVDAVAETLAVLVPAGLAFGVFAAAAVPAVQDIQRKMQAVYTTSQALGTQIYPLTGGFTNLAKAAQPKVYQLFGEALVVMQQNSGKLLPVITQVGNVLDQLGARAGVALTSGGFGTFLRNGPHDVSEIGNIIGNIFGTIGNLVHVMPGYAQTLLQVLDDVTQGIEHVTSSPIAQWILGAGLALHGFLIWGGLAATGAVLLGNALVGLAAKFGLAEAGALAFDAAQFGAGIKTMLGGIVNLGAAMFALDGAEAATAVETGVLAGAMTALDAVNPLVWVGLAAAALGGLIFWLTRTTSATNDYDTAVNNALKNAPVSNFGIDLTQRMSDTVGNLRAAQAQLNDTQKIGIIGYGRFGNQIMGVTQAYQQQAAIVAGYQGELQTLQGVQNNYNTLLKAAHGNLGLLNDAGITSNDIFGASGTQLKQYVLEVQAAAAAQQALGLGVGRSAAAQNAQTNEWLTSGLPAMQKVVQAEDAITSLILSGEQAFVGFDQTLEQLGKDLGVSADSLLGLNSAGLTVSSDIYNQVLPALQKTIDAAQNMNVSTGDLTKIIATEGGQFLRLAGNSSTARAALVGMINNALGPGTVSMRSLNTWIRNNSTSQAGLNTLWSNATVAAGSLAGVIQQQLTAQFIALSLQQSGAVQATVNFKNALLQTGAASSSTKQARAILIQDLINAGDSASQAAAYVDGLQRKLSALHGSTATVHITGDGNVILTGSDGKQYKISAGAYFSPHAAGGPILGGVPFSGAAGDNVLVSAQIGEAIVPVNKVAMLAPALSAAGIPGFAQGGVVGSLTAFPQLMQSKATQLVSDALFSASQSALNAVIASLPKSYIPPRGTYPTGGGTPTGNALLAYNAYKSQMSASDWAAWNYVAMAESGWNQFATNPSSGAYGIPQALPYTKMPVTAWPIWAGGLSLAAPQIAWMWDYMRNIYGGPQGAAAHEAAFHWYDHGGILQPGWSYNGTGRGEMVTPATTMEDVYDILGEISDKLDNVTAAAAASGAQAGASIGRVLSGVARGAINGAMY